MANRIISPSLLSANFLELSKDIEMINKSDAEWLHLDVMDGVFVPNISFGIPVIQAVSKQCTKKLDLHLMIVEPDKFIDVFADMGIYMYTVHYEACTHLHRTIQKIKAKGMKAGMALNPHTPISLLQNIINDVDMVLLMSVNPGYGGQKFITETLNKTQELRELIIKRGSNAIIQIDGGVNYETGKQLFDAGADCLVAGSFVFGSNEAETRISNLLKL